MSGFRSKLNFANVCSFLALLTALGTGTAYAANTVFSTDIVNGEVKTADIGNNQVRSADVRNDSLAGGGLTGADIRQSTLTAIDAQKLGGRTPQETSPQAINLFGAGAQNLFGAGSGISVSTSCHDNDMEIDFDMPGGGLLNLSATVDGVEAPTSLVPGVNLINGSNRYGRVISPGDLAQIALGDPSGNAGAEIQMVFWKFQDASSPSATYSAVFHLFHVVQTGGNCEALGTAMLGL